MKKVLCVALSAMMLLPAVPIHAKQNTTINKTFITLPKKNSYTLKIKGTKKKVKWSSSKKKVVAVTKSGKVIAKKSGTAYITAKVNGQTLKCEVSVRSHKSITINYGMLMTGSVKIFGTMDTVIYITI